jgi:hypothetical protein
MLEDSIHGPINDQTAWRLYGRKDSDETLLSRVKDPIKRKRMLEKLRREHRHIRAMAGKGRAALLSGTKGPSQSEAIALHKIDEFRSPQKDVEKYLSSIDEQRRPQMALRRSNGVPLTSAELESLAKQIEIDKLTPYGASRGALAGLKSLMLPSGFSLAKANRKLCDPETNICSSVPARAYRRLIPGSKRSPSDTLPGHLLTEFNTAPVAITRKKEWLRQLENTKRNRTLAGLGLVGLAGLLGGGLGYAGYNLTRDRDA